MAGITTSIGSRDKKAWDAQRETGAPTRAIQLQLTREDAESRLGTEGPRDG